MRYIWWLRSNDLLSFTETDLAKLSKSLRVQVMSLISCARQLSSGTLLARSLNISTWPIVVEADDLHVLGTFPGTLTDTELGRLVVNGRIAWDRNFSPNFIHWSFGDWTLTMPWYGGDVRLRRNRVEVGSFKIKQDSDEIMERQCLTWAGVLLEVSD